ncbi:MAG: ATP-dependent DNA helicase, partial [Bacteroidia bacterium]|nr:ATP-dependent DNA helicase [Bacteroidia bacterium]
PGMQALHDRRELEEERRLFYVAVTRAEKHLCLSHAETRYRWGNLTYCEPSRFINDIDPQFLAVATPKFRQQIPSNNGSSGLGIKKTYTPFSTRPLPHPGTPAPQKGSPPIEPSPIEEIQPGCQVEHQRFGSGEVLSVDGVGANKKATVNFHQAGKKQLLLKFAKLHIRNK